jgi:hypothetical protein
MLIRCLFSRPRRWLILVVVFAALALPSGAAARPHRQIPDDSVCRPLQADAWFEDTLSFDALTIAPGVLVKPLENGVRLSNSTDTPLYLVEEVGATTLHTPAAPISLTAPLGVRRRVLAGEVASWYSADRSSAPQWNAEHGVASLEYDANTAGEWLPGFTQDLNYGDDRPAGVALPPAKTYTLQVIYGDELIAIPVTQTYRLNPGYVPDRQAACAEWSNNQETYVKSILICGAIAIIASGFLVVYGVIWLLRPAA